MSSQSIPDLGTKREVARVWMSVYEMFHSCFSCLSGANGRSDELQVLRRQLSNHLQHHSLADDRPRCHHLIRQYRHLEYGPGPRLDHLSYDGFQNQERLKTIEIRDRSLNGAILIWIVIFVGSL